MFLKNRNISYKIKRSKVTDYAALIVKLPKQYKNKEGVKISTIVFTQTIVLVSELISELILEGNLLNFHTWDQHTHMLRCMTQSIHYSILKP